MKKEKAVKILQKLIKNCKNRSCYKCVFRVDNENSSCLFANEKNPTNWDVVELVNITYVEPITKVGDKEEDL